MARYQEGDRYLSEQEYELNVSELIVGALLLIGVLLIGVTVGAVLTYSFRDLEWPKVIQFSLIIFISSLCGYLAAQDS